MEEMSKHGKVGRAAMMACVDRKTASKYIHAGSLPSEMVRARDWRTRNDPFAEHWDEVEALLIRKVLRRCDGNISQAAEALGLSRAALYRRIEKYGI